MAQDSFFVVGSAVIVVALIALAGTHLPLGALARGHRGALALAQAQAQAAQAQAQQAEDAGGPVGFLTLRDGDLDLLSATAHPVRLPLVAQKGGGAYYALPDERLGASMGAKVVDARGTVAVDPAKRVSGLSAGQHLDVVVVRAANCRERLSTGDVVAVPAYASEFEVTLY